MMFSSMDAASAWWNWIEMIAALYRRDPSDPSFDTGGTLSSPIGSHGVMRGDEGEGGFIIIGMTMPDGVFAEIENGTYGELHGIRIYAEVDA